MSLRTSLSCALVLSALTACAGVDSRPASSDATAAADTRQYVTGSRLPTKGHGGTEAIRTIGQTGFKDQTRSVIEPRPTSN